MLNFSLSVYTVENNEDFESLPNRTISDHTKMSDIIISKDAIESKLSKLKTDKSPGMDQLHPRVVYETRDVISYPLFLICQKSLALGKLPSDWKLARSQLFTRKDQNQIEPTIDQ